MELNVQFYEESEKISLDFNDNNKANISDEFDDCFNAEAQNEEPISIEFTEDQSINTEVKDLMRGEDGFSPLINISKTGKVTTISITDKNGVHTAAISDGDVAEVPIDNNTLVLQNGTLKVNTVDTAEADNTLPITSAGTYLIMGNINALLSSI